MDKTFTLSNSRKVLQETFKKYFNDCGFDNFLDKLGQPFLFRSFYHRIFIADIHHVEIEKNHLGYGGVPGSVKKLIQIRLLNVLESIKDIIEEDIKKLKEIDNDRN